MNFPLQPGEHVTWHSKFGKYSIRVQRTDAGQTWTVDVRQGNYCLNIQAFEDEAGARICARMHAEMYRDLEAYEMQEAKA